MSDSPQFQSCLLPWQQQLNTSEVSSQMSPELRVTSSDQSHAVSSPAGAKTQPQLPPQARQASNRAAHSSKGQATCTHRRKECLYISLPSTPRLFLREYPGKGLTSQHRTMRQQHHPATQIPLRWGQKRGEERASQHQFQRRAARLPQFESEHDNSSFASCNLLCIEA